MALKQLFLIIFLFGFVGCDNRTQKERFDKFVYDEYHSNYGGIIIDKYFDKENHNRSMVKIETELFGIKKKDYTFQSLQLFDFLQIGDTLLKESESIKLQIKRIDLDTVIYLDFGNFRGKNLYYWENKYIKREFKIND